MKVIETRVINSKLFDLLELRGESSSWPPLLASYLEVLIAYLRNDGVELHLAFEVLKSLVSKQCTMSLDNKENLQTEAQARHLQVSGPDLLTIAHARLRYRSLSHLSEALEDLSTIESPSPLWMGEVSFVKALLYGAQKDFERESKCYLEASSLLTRAGAPAKALLALQNAIAAEESLRPQKNFIIDYSQLLSKALKARCSSTVGLSALNLSRQYQNLGSRQASLKYANMAIKFLRNDCGTQHYGLALCQRAHVLMEIGRTTEANLNIEEAKGIDFVEVQNAIRWLESLSQDSEFRASGNEAPAWVVRGSPGDAQPPSPMGILEEKLVRILAKGPMNKYDLVAVIYSDESKTLDYETILNRFKNLLARVRKKAPNLIVFDGKRYFLTAGHPTALQSSSAGTSS